MNCVDYFFEKTSTSTKDFIIGTHEKISFESVYEASNQVAAFLNREIGSGEKIILVGQNSVFLVTAYLGILKSGNICVPLNPAIEQTNLDFIIKKTNAKLIFLSRIIQNKLQVDIPLITENDYSSVLNSKHETIAEKDIIFDSNTIAEIIFTSGSTSVPKGVMLTHRNIISNTESIISYLGLSDDDVMLVVLPFFYCYGLSLLHTHLRMGAQLVLNNNFMFLASTINNLNKYNCTGFAGVPSHFQILLRKTELFKKSNFPSLRYVTQAGGKLHSSFINEFAYSFPSIKFFVMYGQTEATARLSYLPPEILTKKMGSIGKGIPEVTLKVVNEYGNEVQPGVVGEIVAKGENIMAGYYDDPEETSKALQNGWLHTGDLGTIDEDGYIYLTARKKEIIKVGGKRISPKEIEEIIQSIPEIIDCTVEGIPDEILGESIKLTVVKNDKGDYLTENYIRDYCSSRLSPYKIPSVIEFKESTALNAAGKKIKSQ
ncbi:MAG: AMP-binding protein [Prolixibacteraceae bacterium]|nr:AMP-binding protein [Prolixibacteraceae bacterium]